MRNWGALLIALIGAILLAVLATTPPSPVAADAPATTFSAARAMTDLRTVARAPHPTGSVENGHVQFVLMNRLAVLGMEQEFTVSSMARRANKRLDDWRGRPAPAPSLINITGVLPGRDRSLPAVLLMAHYDSVWGSPGAADDGVGVVTIIETVRAIRAAGQQRRDLIVLFSDGEELGLEGAVSFFENDALRKRVGVIINLEARGGGGRTSMFETGNDDGAMMGLFGAAVNNPVATSLSVFVYKQLPNSTDLTIAKNKDYPGFNFSFIGRPGLYHSPLATPDALDQGALQDMGRQTLDLTRALLAAPQLPGKAPDKTFFDVFGLFLITYPAGLGWLFLALGAGGYVVSAWERGGLYDVKLGAGALLGVIVLGGIFLYVGNLVSGADGPVNYYDRLDAIPRLQVQAACLCLAAFVLVWGLAWKWCRSSVVTIAGAALPLFVLGLVAQATAPTAAYPIGVPLMLGGLAAALGRFAPRGGRIAQTVVAALIVGYMIALGYQLMQAVGPDVPMVAALPLAIAGTAVAPVLPGIGRRPAFIAAGVLVAIALGIALWVRLDAVAPSVAVYSVFK